MDAVLLDTCVARGRNAQGWLHFCVVGSAAGASMADPQDSERRGRDPRLRPTGLTRCSGRVPTMMPDHDRSTRVGAVGPPARGSGAQGGLHFCVVNCIT
jgi:hypothetical protein